MKIELIEIKKLKPSTYNPRKISDKELDGLKQSIKKFGIVDPIIVNERNMTIVGGHMRVRAAEALGMQEVPCVLVDLSLSEEKALNVALNSPTIAGKFDEEILGELLKEIKTDLPDIFEGMNFQDLVPIQIEKVDYSENNEEIDTENFGNDLQHCCPKCGFEFNE